MHYIWNDYWNLINNFRNIFSIIINLKKREEFLDNRLNTKREEIKNINKKLEKLEKDKEKEIDEKLKDKI